MFKHFDESELVGIEKSRWQYPEFIFDENISIKTDNDELKITYHVNNQYKTVYRVKCGHCNRGLHGNFSVISNVYCKRVYVFFGIRDRHFGEKSYVAECAEGKVGIYEGRCFWPVTNGKMFLEMGGRMSCISNSVSSSIASKMAFSRKETSEYIYIPYFLLVSLGNSLLDHNPSNLEYHLDPLVVPIVKDLPSDESEMNSSQLEKGQLSGNEMESPHLNRKIIEFYVDQCFPQK